MSFDLAPFTCELCFIGYSQFLAELGSDKEGEEEEEEGVELSTLPCYLPGLMGCRNVESYEWLNRIEEGTYGVVHRAKDKKTGMGVARGCGQEGTCVWGGAQGKKIRYGCG